MKYEEQWANAGFIRNEDGEVWLIWECTKCGFQGLGSMEPPKCKCPECCGTVTDLK